MLSSRLARFAVLSGLLAGLLFAAQPAAAQQMGRDGYSFPARSASLAAQFDFQRRQANSTAAASSAAGLAALNQYVTTYSSTSTSVGNMVTVNQNLADGSTGTVSTATDQTSDGDQGSSSTADVAIDNSIVSTETVTVNPTTTEPEAAAGN